MELAVVVLAFVVAALLYERFRSERAFARERERLVNRIIADRPSDVAALDREPRPPAERKPVEIPEGM